MKLDAMKQKSMVWKTTNSPRFVIENSAFSNIFKDDKLVKKLEDFISTRGIEIAIPGEIFNENGLGDPLQVKDRYKRLSNLATSHFTKVRVLEVMQIQIYKESFRRSKNDRVWSISPEIQQRFMQLLANASDVIDSLSRIRENLEIAKSKELEVLEIDRSMPRSIQESAQGDVVRLIESIGPNILQSLLGYTAIPNLNLKFSNRKVRKILAAAYNAPFFRALTVNMYLRFLLNLTDAKSVPPKLARARRPATGNWVDLTYSTLSATGSVLVTDDIGLMDFHNYLYEAGIHRSRAITSSDFLSK